MLERKLILPVFVYRLTLDFTKKISGSKVKLTRENLLFAFGQFNVIKLQESAGIPINKLN